IGILGSCRAKVKGNTANTITLTICWSDSYRITRLSPSPPNLALLATRCRQLMVEMNTMPSPFGHALGGVAAAWAIDLLPGARGWRSADAHASFYRRAGGALTLICAALGTAPDADLVLTTHRTATHSLTAA